MDCEIRKWRYSDAADLAALLNDADIQNNLRDGLPYPYTESDALEYIRSMLAADSECVFAFAITLHDRPIGSIGVFRQENIHFRTAEMGYYIGKAWWGNGYATSAVRQTCETVFAQSDLIRIFAEPFADNFASCRVLEKSGFRSEGILRCNAVKNGKIRDMKLYARIREDFEPGN